MLLSEGLELLDQIDKLSDQDFQTLLNLMHIRSMRRENEHKKEAQIYLNSRRGKTVAERVHRLSTKKWRALMLALGSRRWK